MRVVLIHYNEIALKGGNRRFFENKLIENIRNFLGFKKILPNSLLIKGGGGGFVKKIPGRILIELDESADIGELENKLKKVFGIANFSFVSTIKYVIPAKLVLNCDQGAGIQEAIRNQCWEFLKNKKFTSFAIKTSRADKTFPLTSQRVNETVGDFIKLKSGASVDLDNPEIVCFIEIANGYIFIYDKKIKGAGGMPAGVAGKVVSLISSGFDSPVASYLMMKRGAEIIFVHFHSYPETSLSSRENVEELIKVLSEYQSGSKIYPPANFIKESSEIDSAKGEAALRLVASKNQNSSNRIGGRVYFVNLLKIQKEIMMKAPEKFRVVLYRRAMVKIANEIAKKENALGLVTGDSLGQVASQTLENLNTVSRASELPVYRPLIGFDKEEIINLSKKIGFYEFSSRPYDDCCSLFVPKHPATKSDIETIEKIENKLKLDKLLKEAVKKAETINY